MARDPKSYDWNPYIYATASYGLTKVIQYKVYFCCLFSFFYMLSQFKLNYCNSVRFCYRLANGVDFDCRQLSKLKSYQQVLLKWNL